MRISIHQLNALFGGRALVGSSEASFSALTGAVAAERHEQISERALTLDQAAAIARNWSLIHGFTTLLLDCRLAHILEQLPAGTTADMLLDAMLKLTVARNLGS